MRATKFLLFLVFGFALPVSGQLNQGFIHSFGSSGFSEDAEHIAIDSKGNIWMLGDFESTWSPPSGSGSRSFSSKGWKDTYLLKMDAEGKTLWCGALQNSYDSWVTGIEVDQEDNVIFTGAFRGTMDFNPSNSAEKLIGAGVSNWHGYILKLDTNGDFLWASKFGTTGNSWHVYARDIVADSDNNLYIAGTFSNPMAYGPLELASVGPSTFVIKISKNGGAVWAKKISSVSTESRGSVLAIGANQTLYVSTNTNLSILKLSDGSTVAGLNGNTTGTGIDADANGVYAHKLKDRTNDFIGTSSITKYTYSNHFAWINDYDRAIFYELKVSPYGLYAYGSAPKGVNIMPSNQEPTFYDGPEDNTGIIQKLDPYTGKVVKNTFFPSSQNVQFFGMDYNADKLVSCGTFHGNASLNFKDPSTTYNGGSFGSSFIMSWEDCPSEIDQESLWSCKPITVDGRRLDVSGRYYSTNYDDLGCITTASIDLELDLFDKVAQSNGDQLYINEQTFDIQWLNCKTKQLVPNANAYSFIPSDDSPYSAVLVNSGCKDTSNCVSIKDYSFEGEDITDGYEFGSRISISGDWAAISTKHSNKSRSGFVYLFKNEGNKWVQKTKIAPIERSSWDYFGDALSLFDDLLAIGAWNDDTQDQDAGKVYLYRLIGDEWVFEQSVFGDDIDKNDRFGKSVELYYDLLVVGAPNKNANNNNSIQSKEGAVYVFKPSGKGPWVQTQKLINFPANAQDNFGSKIRIEEGQVYISAPYARNNENSNIGSIHHYKIEGNNSLSLINRLSYADDSGIGVDFDVSGNHMLAATSKSILYFEKVGSSWQFKEEVIERSDLPVNPIVRISGNYAAYKEAEIRAFMTDLKMLHFDGETWKPHINFNNGKHIDTHISDFDLENWTLVMGAHHNSQYHDLGGRVFTFYYKFSLTSVNNSLIQPIEVYPNPSRNQIRINTDLIIQSVYAIDLNGHQYLLSPKHDLDVSQLPSGINFLYITDTDGNLFTGKFLKL